MMMTMIRAGLKSCLLGAYLALTLPPSSLHSHIVLSGHHYHHHHHHHHHYPHYLQYPSATAILSCQEIIIIILTVILTIILLKTILTIILIVLILSIIILFLAILSHQAISVTTLFIILIIIVSNFRQIITKLFSVGSACLSTSTSYGRHCLKYSIG